MQIFKTDLHNHTLMSPCGDLDMTPDFIIEEAKRKGIDVIGITDHNCTRHCRLAEHFSHNRDIFVLCGAEVTTKEEAHCLAFFENHETLDLFQKFLDEHLPNIPTHPTSSATKCRLTRSLKSCMRSPSCSPPDWMSTLK